MIPLLHDFIDERVLVFGGGPVGARKARRFAREAEVFVVSPTFADADFGGADRIRAAPRPDDVDDLLDRFDPALVIAATDENSLNDAVADRARERGILINRADRPGSRSAGSVVVPATVRDGPVVVAVATDGTAPALSRYLRAELAEELDGAGEMAALLAEARTALREAGVDADERRRRLTALVESPGLWTALRTGDVKYAQVIEDVLQGSTPAGGDGP